MKRALITGISGQDGSYLAELLLEKGYEVYGVTRRSSSEDLERIAHVRDQILLESADLTDESSVINLIQRVRPSEVYNLAAQSFVPTSWEQPILTSTVTGLGVTRMLEAIRRVDPDIRFYQASSSEMFGDVRQVPQNEDTPLHPRSPCGIAKAYGHWMTVSYRESHDLFACSGICFNHESPRRGLEFVSRRISHGVARIKLGLASELRLGNVEVQRDWGFAGDYVEAMWRMLQQDQPGDYVVATGETHRVWEMAKLAFECVDLDYQDYLVLDSELIRPGDVDLLVGDPTKAATQLQWSPALSFENLVETMVQTDLERLSPRGGPSKQSVRPFARPIVIMGGLSHDKSTAGPVWLP